MDPVDIAKFNKQQYADWLWRGLVSVYSKPISDRGDTFDGWGYIILQQGSIFEGLQHIYEEYIPPSRQLIFRSAIGDVLRNHANESGISFSVIQDILYLLGVVKAVESLDALLPTIGNGQIGRNNPRIFYQTLAVLNQLIPSSQVKKTTQGLIRSRNFNKGDIFEAVKILVKCDPISAVDMILNNANKMRDVFLQSYKNSGKEWKAFNSSMRFFIRTLLESSLSSFIPDLWKKAKHNSDDMWLFIYLFSNKYIPVNLYYDEEENEFFVSYESSYQSYKEILVTSYKDYNTRRILENIQIDREFNSSFSDPTAVINSIEDFYYNSKQDQLNKTYCGYAISNKTKVSIQNSDALKEAEKILESYNSQDELWKRT